MQYSARFYRFASACSLMSALTTLALIFLPSFWPQVGDFDARMALVHDPFYTARAWIYLLHPFLVFAAALGIALRFRDTGAGWCTIGLAGFALWAATEAAQQALTLTTMDRWRLAYDATDLAARTVLEARVVLYDALWDAMYFLLLLGFALGNTCYAAVLMRERRVLARCVALSYATVAVLTVILIVREAGGPNLLPATLASWAYPIIQPLARVMIGVLLWREARDDPAPLRA